MRSLVPDILFPSRCAGCGSPVAAHHHYLCPDCAGLISIIDDACPVCSGPMSAHGCGACADRHWYVTQSIVLSDYGGVMKRVICRMKFGRIRAIHAALGAIALKELARREVTADLVTWVPMSPRKSWERGFNQSELLARFISRKTGIPCRRLLREKPGAMAQRSLGLRDRFINSLCRYELLKPGLFYGSRVLIVDDVRTTGSTVNECARQLRSAGADRVFSLAIARTDIKRLEKF